MWDSGQVTAHNLFWQEGNADWQPLQGLIAKLEPKAKTRAIAQPDQIVQEIAPRPQPRAVQRIAAAVTLPEYETQPVKSAAPASNVERVLWEGNPTAWHYAGHIVIGCLLLPLLIGIPILLRVWIQITFHKYKITSKRVSIQTGMFAKEDRELRIQDIRSTAARTNIFGTANVEFSSAATADAEIIFIGVRKGNYVRDLVKNLQN